MVLRSALFNILFYGWAVVVSLLFFPTLFLPRKFSQPAQKLWANGLVWLLRTVVGIRMEIRGREHIATGPVLIASKHQSAWETIIFHLLLDDPVMVIKRELFCIPLYGWYAFKWRMIGISRGPGAGTEENGRRRSNRGRPRTLDCDLSRRDAIQRGQAIALSTGYCGALSRPGHTGSPGRAEFRPLLAPKGLHQALRHDCARIPATN